MDIEIFGQSYSFPEIRDHVIEARQSDIQDVRRRIEEGSKNRSYLFGMIKKPPNLSPEERLRMMETLVNHYDELIQTLKEKIGACREGFLNIGNGVRNQFQEKIRAIEQAELKRVSLAEKARKRGQEETAAQLEADRERNRTLAMNLARASILIIRKLRHALEALSILVDDESAQRNVVESLRSNLGLYREVFEYYREVDDLQRHVEELTRTALNFDSLLRDKLGPLAVLIEEISRVDTRVADSLAEIETLSRQLETQQTIQIGGWEPGDRILDLLAATRVKQDVLESIISAMADSETQMDAIKADTELAEAGSLDFDALADNMAHLVDQGLSDLRFSASAPVSNPEKKGGSRTARKSAEKTEPDPTPSAAEDASSLSADAEEPTAGDAAAIVAEPSPEPAKASREKPRASRPDSPRKREQYSAAISRKNPTLIIFLLDRSGSMADEFSPGLRKADHVAATTDRTIEELCARCAKADGIRDYFHIACIGFGDDRVESLLPGKEEWVPVSVLAERPARLLKDENGNARPSWIEPLANGSTPLRAAFERACTLAAGWCDAHASSYPPTVIAVTDGDSSDGDPGRAAEILRQIHTDDGPALLFNLHISAKTGKAIVFPNSPKGLDEYGKLLFSMSSPFPPHLYAMGENMGFNLEPDSRFFAYGADSVMTTRFFDLGTRPSGMR